MRSEAVSDLLSLAHLARHSHADLRPLLLRIQTQTFVAAKGRGAAVARDYEALALGLIPLVTDDVLAEVAAMLKAAEDVPSSVSRALRERLHGPAEPQPAVSRMRADALRQASCPDLTRAEMQRLLMLQAPDIDTALARNGAIRLDGHDLAGLVERARRNGTLARALLGRAELAVEHRAALHRFAPRELRQTIRAEVTAHLARRPAAPAARTGAASRILSLAAGQIPPRVFPFIGAELRLEAGFTCDLADGAGREHFVLALRALDMEADDVISLLLRLDWPGALSVGIVFELAALARSVSPAVAACLVGAEAAPDRAGETGRTATRDQDRSRRVAPLSERRDGPQTSLSPAFPTRAAVPSALPDHRPRSTTGPDRT